MGRSYKKKSNKGLFTADAMKQAVHLVVDNNCSIRQAAELNSLSFQTLARYVTKYKKDKKLIVATPRYDVRRIFSDHEEQMLAKYIENMSKMCYGLSTVQCRKLAFEMAGKNSISVPESWKRDEAAGLEWFRNFIKRHEALSIRRPEACSLSRMTSFNKTNVTSFFNKLEEVLLRNEKFADGTRIWNLDETATTTVQRPGKIVATKGLKQVNQCTSADRGILTTTCCFISASGNTIPPVMVFPRQHFKDHMVTGAIPGTLGLANPSGWMNSDLFEQVMCHFVKYTNSSETNPTLLIYDNHESHLSIKALDIAKNNFVTILTIPPHCSSRMQPLDVSVFSSFKANYNSALSKWMLQHPGKTVSIFDVAQLVCEAHHGSMTPKNICSGFKKTGIFPFNPDVFNDDDFLISAVTNRAESSLPNTDGAYSTLESLTAVRSKDLIAQSLTDAKFLIPLNSGAGCSKDFISPQDFRGYPKAGERKKKQGGRKPRKCIIATDTPEKEQIELEQSIKSKKKQPQTKVYRKLVTSLSSSDEEMVSIHDDSSGEETFSDLENPVKDVVPIENAKKGDFVLIKFTTSKKIKYYVAQLLSEKNEYNEYYVTYARKSEKLTGDKFCFPNVPDNAYVHQADIHLILPEPQFYGKTKRQNRYFSFSIKFSSLNIQ